jgi:RNA polymerase sigma-70 factor (ECF subfamily)
MNAVNCLDRTDEETLIARSSQGDLEAFNQLVLIHQDMLFHHALTLLGDSDLAEDAAQESFIKAFQNIRSFRGGSFRAWLLKIATNSAYDMMRRSHRHPAIPLLPEDEYGEETESPAWIADSASVQETVEQEEFSQALYRMLDKLPEAYRSVITLIDVQDLDYQEAAQALSLPIGTIKSRLARARMQIRQKLQGALEYAGGPGSAYASQMTEPA